MQKIEIMQQMIDYHYTFWDKVWESIMTLTDEQFGADIPYSHGSIRNHMVHVAAVDIGWVRGLQGIKREDQPPRPQAEDFPTRESVRELCAKTEKHVRDYIATLSEDDLSVRPEHMPMTIAHTILHIVNHGTDHRAQVLRALHDAGADTFDQDLAFYHMQG